MRPQRWKAWPMMADQHLNAMFVVDVAGIGLRICASNGTKHGLVKELVGGEGGRMAEEKVGRLAEAAQKAMMEGGSSVVALEQMIEGHPTKGANSHRRQRAAGELQNFSLVIICCIPRTNNLL